MCSRPSGVGSRCRLASGQRIVRASSAREGERDLWRRITPPFGAAPFRMDTLRTYLHLREWGELAYLLDLPWGFWVAAGVMLVGLVGLLWPQR